MVAFDINGLLDTLTGTSMEELCLELKYVPWTYTSTESALKKISSIYRTMSWYVTHGGSNIPSFVNRRELWNIAEGRATSQPRTQCSRNQANINALAR